LFISIHFYKVASGYNFQFGKLSDDALVFDIVGPKKFDGINGR
jgi:hypothetical protein